MANFIADFRSKYSHQQINGGEGAEDSVSAAPYDEENDDQPSPPPFLNCTYAQALSQARRELKFLLVYLHGDDHEDSPAFCRNIICAEEFREFLRGDGDGSSTSRSILLWACNVNSGEGFRVSQALREHTYPFIGLIVQINGRMTLVGRVEGAVDSPSSLIDKLKLLIRV